MNGTDYYEFVLDANENTPEISLEQLKIHVDSSSTLSGYPGSFPSPVYDLDSGGDNWVKLDASVAGSGSGRLDMAALIPTSLIGSVALGIAVDDTVHFLVRYGRARRRGTTPEEAALLCARRAGRAIAITSFMLMAGFLVVGLSSFATLRQFGVLSAATMGVCLLTDLVLLPALLVRTRS